MPKRPRLTAPEVEQLLLGAGFVHVRSNRIYRRGQERLVLPFHSGKTLHPKIIKHVMDAVGE
ncbi:MAG: addiction module toxin, HicA family [Verrucomicrobia bacterium]|nr:addiction module toxin, HicA family [Verrucomicrobiota bacterium]